MARKIKAVLIDLSGTLHVDDYAIPGAVEALKRLRETGASIRFVTNTTKESQRLLHDRLNKLGFVVGKDEVFSSLQAARQVLISRQLNPLLLVDDAAVEDFTDLPKEGELNAVVIGLAPSKFHYDELNTAFRLLRSGSSLIAIHEGRYYKRSDGLALGPGAFVKGLEYAANVKAEVIGKPTAEFFHAALGQNKPEEAVMIGDDVKDDVAGAQAVGIKGILVKTGKYQAGDEDTISPPPYKVCSSFVEAVEVLAERIV